MKIVELYTKNTYYDKYQMKSDSNFFNEFL